MNENTATATPSRERERPPSSDNKQEKSPAVPKRPWYKRPLLAGGIFLVIIATVVGGTLFWLHSRNYELTDDAFIDVAPEQVSAQVPGRVTRVLVDDNQDVTPGPALVEPVLAKPPSPQGGHPVAFPHEPRLRASRQAR